MKGTAYRILEQQAKARGYVVTSTTGGKHNPGSLHPLGGAIDVRTNGLSDQQVEDMMDYFESLGHRVVDERERPPGQTEWDGAHVHVEYGRRHYRASYRPRSKQPSMKLAPVKRGRDQI